MNNIAQSVVPMTTWHNPTRFPQTISLILDASGRQQRITIGPGEDLDLPSIHDKAVQTVINGVRVGGQAPWLVNKSLPVDQRPPLHEEHDREFQERKAKAAAIGAATVTATIARDLAAIAEEVATAPDPKPAKK